MGPPRGCFRQGFWKFIYKLETAKNGAQYFCGLKAFTFLTSLKSRILITTGAPDSTVVNRKRQGLPKLGVRRCLAPMANHSSW